jgi:GNAT superfamily N-acetyltransferase
MSELCIRPASLADHAVITQFNLLLALETERLVLDQALVGQGVHAILGDASKGLYFVAETGNEVVGQVMITYEWSDWRNGNIWWLQSVYVRQDHRARGVFRALFSHLKTLAETTPGVCGMRLYMHSGNQKARQVYANLGFDFTEYEVFELPLAVTARRRGD